MPPLTLLKSWFLVMDLTTNERFRPPSVAASRPDGDGYPAIISGLGPDSGRKSSSNDITVIRGDRFQPTDVPASLAEETGGANGENGAAPDISRRPCRHPQTRRQEGTAGPAKGLGNVIFTQ